jgi:uncharacterized protein YecT (DUF1311 family)
MINLGNAQRFALLAGGRAWIKLREQDSAWVKIKPENAADSHPSSARFVGWFSSLINNTNSMTNID